LVVHRSQDARTVTLESEVRGTAVASGNLKDHLAYFISDAVDVSTSHFYVT
jgi:hypothetical protein